MPSGTRNQRHLRRGPVDGGERAIAPDLARGCMLLLIVVSNSMFFLWAGDPQAHFEPAEGLADRIARFLMALVLDLRAFPLFAFLFGYGMTQLYRRQLAAGTSTSAAWGVLRRRSLWLLVFGFLHAALLLASDVLFAYGVISLLLGWLFLHRADRALRLAAAIAGALVAAMFAFGALLFYGAGTGRAEQPLTFAAPDAAAEPNYLLSALVRLESWPAISAMTILGITAPAAMLLGMWAARRRILEEPHRNLALLRRTAVLGSTIGLVGAAPAALATLGALSVGSQEGELGVFAMQWSSGLAAGLGYIALFGLLAHQVAGRPGVVVTAVSAVGRRSLSTYLAHSVLLAPVLAAWGLGLGQYLGEASMAGYAVLVWLSTVFAGYALHRAARPGPAEAALRGLIYR
ncbi:DUF418 domain-containing protein [Tamaricihabitans halophyticus]|nr:DUF418 domain-containing protein [Tamaricihabitans halophyticus]